MIICKTPPVEEDSCCRRLADNPCVSQLSLGAQFQKSKATEIQPCRKASGYHITAAWCLHQKKSTSRQSMPFELYPLQIMDKTFQSKGDIFLAVVQTLNILTEIVCHCSAPQKTNRSSQFFCWSKMELATPFERQKVKVCDHGIFMD